MGVIAAHGLALLYTIYFGDAVSSVPPSPPPRLVVNTITLSAPEEKKLLTMVATAEPFILPEPEVVSPPAPEPAVEEPSPPKPPEPKPEPPTPETPKPEPKKKKEVAVVKKPAPAKAVKKTVQATPPKPKKKPEEKVAAVKPKPKTAEKKQPSKDQQIAANEEKKKRQQQEAAKDSQKRQAIAKAQESLAKMQQCAGKMTNNINTGMPATTPTSIECLQIDTLQPLSNQEIGYRDSLAIRLKKLLCLPEYGDVQLKLTLGRTGNVTKVVIVKSKSDRNRKYIEQTLPSLHFPAFGSNFSGSDLYTFLVNLTNDD